MKYIIIAYLLIILFVSCKSKTIYVPIDTVKTEYKDVFRRDSVFMYDSIFVLQKNDTVFYQKYKYLYRDKVIKDSVFVHDSIQVPYPVTEYKEVNKLSSFQSFQIWCGRIALLLLAGYMIWRKVIG
ncbi:MAG: hypothetical protein E6767_02430 [Dysgonomonas sp.]|nr:hypothetical protein [Dysgonomonas sp.]